MVQNQPREYAQIKRHKSITIGITEDILIYEIFTRLPVITLLRFKSVCKSWRDTISNPSFVAAHLDRSKKSPKYAIVPLMPNQQRKINIYSYEGQGHSSASFLFGKEFAEVQNSLAPLHHSNGLLLLYISTQLIVCNPSTRKSVALPEGSHNALTSSKPVTRAGSGFVPGSDVYKVAQYFYRSYNYDERTYSIGFEVFTFGSDNSWRVTARDPPYPIKVCSSIVSAGGSIYFKVDNSLHTSSPEFILSFDLRDEKFTVIPPPSCFRSLHGSYTELKKLIGCYFLREVDDSLYFITRCPEEDKYEMWMYQNRNDHTWVHSFTIKFPNHPEFFSFVTVRNGKLLLEVDDGEDKLVWFDPQSKSLETMVRIAEDLAYDHDRKYRCRFGEHCFFQVVRYAESLATINPASWSYNC